MLTIHARTSASCDRTRARRPSATRSFMLLGAMFVLAVTGIVGVSTAGPAVPKAYVGLFNDNAVAVIDTATNRVLTIIPIPVGPHGLVISPDGLRVYASSDGASTVSVISTATDRVVSTLEVGTSPHGVAVTRDGRTLLVAVFGADQVAMIDTIRNQIVARFPVGKPHNIAITPDGLTAYVASQQPGATALVILDLAGRREAGRVPLDKTPRALNFSPDGAALYFTLAGSEAVQVLDPASNQIVAQIRAGASPHHPLFTPKGEYALVAVQGPGELAVIDPKSRKVIGTVPVGKLPHWIATTSDGDTAYVTNEGANTVSVVDVEKQKVLATIPVGNAPRKIVMQAGLSAKTSSAKAGPVSTAVANPAVATEPSQAEAGGLGGIHIANFAFAPPALTVAPGQKVTWTNADSIPHTSTSADKRWNSGPLAPGASFSVTFDKPGTYVYGCSIHPFMQAKVIVGN